MANRNEKRAESMKAASDGTAAPEMTHVIATAEHPSQPLQPIDAPILTREELQALLDAASAEIETLQAGRANDRSTIIELQAHLEMASRQIGAAQKHNVNVIGDSLLQRPVLADELDLDPLDEPEHPGSVAYDAGRKAGMLNAALICETRWAGDIGNHCADSIREAEGKIQ